MQQAQMKLQHLNDDLELKRKAKKEAEDQLASFLRLAKDPQGIIQGLIDSRHSEYTTLTSEIEQFQTQITNTRQMVEKLYEAETVGSLKRKPPIQLNAGNIAEARGGLEIHDRDSGVARHPLFLAAVKTIETKTWDEKMCTICQALQNHERIQDDFFSKVDDKKWGILLQSITSARDTNQTSMNLPNLLQGRETYFSEKLARVLAAFCRSCNLPFHFSHQFPCATEGSKVDAVDIAVFHIMESGEHSLLGLIEVKNKPNAEAKWQLCGYMSEAFESNLIDEHQTISFGLTIDHDKFQLYGLLWSMRATARPLLEHSLLYSALMREKGNVLISYFVCLAALALPSVRCGVAVDNFCPLVGKVEKIHSKVFRETGGLRRLCKLFDYGLCREGDRRPNEDVIDVVYDDTTVEVLKEEPPCGVSVLRTPWFEGTETPKYPEHVALLCDQLHCLHKKGLKHNDVLCQNVVFGGDETNPTTKLIDFDFAHLNIYPSFWNTSFAERHPEAKEGRATKPEHDIYAAIAILCTYFWLNKQKGETEPLYLKFAEGPFETEAHPHLLREWKCASAEDVAKWIRDNGEALLSIG